MTTSKPSNLVRYEGFVFNFDDHTVLIDGEWKKVPPAEEGVPSISGALENGDPLTQEEAASIVRQTSS